MFNMWNRTYIQTFNQRQIFDSKVILGDRQWAQVVFGTESFSDGGAIIAQEWSLDDVVDKHYSGLYSNLLAALAADRDSKWAIVVQPQDYCKMVAHYLKEIQHTFKLSDSDLQLIAFSVMYNNFYHNSDQTFIDGFVDESFQTIMRTVFDSYTAVGVFDNIAPGELSTEIALFLAKRDIISEADVQPKLANIAKLVLTRVWETHVDDFSEWLILDTPQFLNLLKSPDTGEVVTPDISFTDMFSTIKADQYLRSMFFSKFPIYASNTDWESHPDFKVTASRIISAWEGLANYLVQRGIDQTWSELRHTQYAEVILRYEHIINTCSAVKFILGLDGAPESLEGSALDLLGYDMLSECLNSQYNKTLLLITFRGMSSTFQAFVNDAFAIKEPASE